MTLALRLQGLRKRYGKTVALNGLDLDVPRGSITALIGPNGAGKTTAFGIIGGLIRAESGQVDVLGLGPFDVNRHSGRVTLLPQDCELNPHTPVWTLLATYARLQGMTRRVAEREADRVLEEVALSDRKKSRIRQLSHGMRRRVQVAQALLGTPELILLDEPMSGLDPHLVVRMREVLLRGRGQRTLVISSHVLSELEASCDHVIFMERGVSTGAGSMASVTGRRETVRVRFTGSLPTPLRVDGLELVVENDEIVVRAPSDWATEQVTAAVLPVLLQAGVGIVELTRGQSLEAAYMRSRDADGRLE